MNRKERRAASGTGATGPAFVQAFNLGLQLHQAGELEKAVVAYRKALSINPNVALLQNNFGVALYDLNKKEEALVHQRKAIALDPNLGIAYNNLGVTLNSLEMHEEALKVFARAIEIEPNNAKATNNLGDSLVKLSRFDEGVAYLRKALEMEPNYFEAHSNLGVGMWGQGHLDEAIASLRKAIEIQPNLPMARKNIGIISLLRGDYEQGWPEYDWRFTADKIGIYEYGVPIWRGQALPEKTLFVWGEQGVGDEILHISMAADLIKHGFRVMWETDKRLVPFFQRSYPPIKFVARGKGPADTVITPDIGAHIPSASLGRFVRPRAESFPLARRAHLMADQERTKAFRESLALAPGEKLVGISWVSKNVKFGTSKSTTLAQWAEILRTPGVRFVDLQYGNTSAERAALENEHGVKVE
ncbi:MAG: tetratricopeptide repeat protein, partial [Rhodospirillaceae bacterium]|nr:tetratricopeptide repeat protein [Rhodospirillaceae bacterium]